MLWILFLAASFLIGLLLLSLLRIRMDAAEKVCASWVAGFVVSSVACFGLALFLGLPSGAIAFIILSAAVLTAFWRRIDWRFHFGKAHLLLLFILLASFFLVSKIHFDEVDGSWVAGTTVFGDLMYHATVASSFAFGGNFPPQEPVFAGEALRYHFLPDFFTASLMSLGLDLRGGMLVQDGLLTTCLVALLYFFSARLVDGKWGAVFATLLVLTSGGLALWQGYDKGMSLDQAGQKVYDLYHGEYIFQNVLLCLWAQRVLLAGLCVFLLSALLLLRGLGFGERKAQDLRLVAAAGIVAGLSPLVNFYVYFGMLAMLPIAVLLFAKDRPRALAFFLAPALLLALPELPFILSHTDTGYPKVNIFWSAESWNEEAAFMVGEFGLFLPLLLAGLALADRKRKLLYLAPLALLVLVNLFQFQWNEGDNGKFMVLWLVVSAPFTGIVFQRMAENGRVSLALTFILVALAGASGVVGLSFEFSHRYTQVEPAYFELSEWVKANTPPQAVFLTSPDHSHPIVTLAGRRIVEGPYAWVAPHGYDYGKRQGDVRKMYSGSQDAMGLLREYNVSYVVIGPLEGELNPNEEFFAGSGFQKVYDQELGGKRWRIYRVLPA